MKMARLCLVAALLLAAWAPPAGAFFTDKPKREFSADWFHSQSGQESTSKVYVGKQKMRLDHGPGQDQGLIIIRYDQKMMWICMAERKSCLKSRLDEDKLKDMQKDAFSDVIAKKKLGRERVSGYRCDKYRISYHHPLTGKEESATAWWSEKLGTYIRIEGQDGGVSELRNIKLGSQPDSLFELPEGYQMMDLGSLSRGKSDLTQPGTGSRRPRTRKEPAESQSAESKPTESKSAETEIGEEELAFQPVQVQDQLLDGQPNRFMVLASRDESRTLYLFSTIQWFVVDPDQGQVLKVGPQGIRQEGGQWRVDLSQAAPVEGSEAEVMRGRTKERLEASFEGHRISFTVPLEAGAAAAETTPQTKEEDQPPQVSAAPESSPSSSAPAAPQDFQAWFPQPQSGWTTAEARISEVPGAQGKLLMRTANKSYRRQSDGAELSVEIAASPRLKMGAAAAMIGAMLRAQKSSGQAGEPEKEAFEHQGRTGLLETRQGKSSLMFMLDGAKVELSLRPADREALLAYARQLDLNTVVQVFSPAP